MVDLEIARVDDDAQRGADGKRAGVGNRVRDVDELAAQRSQLDGVTGVHGAQLDGVEKAMLAQLVAKEAQGDRCPEHRYREPGQDVWQPADVILVAMGEQDAAHP